MYNSHGNEDLLPRTPIIPSATLAPDAIIKPTVPEVSIILEDQQKKTFPGGNGNINNKPTMSYSAWKKQYLPHVAFIDDGLQGGSSSENSPRNNIYPMKAPQSQMHSISPQPQTYVSPTPIQPGPIPIQQHQVQVHQVQSSSVQSHPIQQPFSQNQLNNNFAIDTDFLSKLKVVLGLNPPTGAPVQQATEELLLSIQPQQQNKSSVLTLCAGTQTDSEPDVQNSRKSEQYATKDDVREIMRQIQEMRTEQIHLMQYLTSLDIKKSTSSTGEMGVQCDLIKAKHQNLFIEEYQTTTPKANFNKQQTKSPYQVMETPLRGNFRDPMNPSKPSTEQSMVMNELALKYLPSHKLSDLLQEIHAHDDNSPLRAIDNVLRTPVNECPNDISTASYKYLKKYRLLPDEEENQDLDLDSIRNQPKFL